MLLALSPYHLTSREPAAMAALTLADRVVTLIPTPAAMGDAVAVRAAAERSARFVELLETWRWSTPLWDADLVASAFEDEDARADVERVISELDTDPALADLQRMFPPRARSHAGETAEESILNAIARDLLRAGPNPAISIPVAAGLDRFAARHDLIAVRAAGPSLAQVAESRLATRLFRIAIPVLTQASAERLLEARASLLAPLENLRDALNEAIVGIEQHHARTAGAEYTDAFEAEREALLRPETDDTMPRVRADTVVIEGVRLPPDAVLASSLTAARKARGRPAPAHEPSARPPLEGEPGVLALVVRVMGR
ncbi:MAG: hypothetical protein ACF8Q5_03920 [Phycisphaerales bacterium JB040]